MRENLQRMAFDIRSITVKCRARFHLLKSCVPSVRFQSHVWHSTQNQDFMLDEGSGMACAQGWELL